MTGPGFSMFQLEASLWGSFEALAWFRETLAWLTFRKLHTICIVSRFAALKRWPGPHSQSASCPRCAFWERPSSGKWKLRWRHQEAGERVFHQPPANRWSWNMLAGDEELIYKNCMFASFGWFLDVPSSKMIQKQAGVLAMATLFNARPAISKFPSFLVNPNWRLQSFPGEGTHHSTPELLKPLVGRGACSKKRFRRILANSWHTWGILDGSRRLCFANLPGSWQIGRIDSVVFFSQTGSVQLFPWRLSVLFTVLYTPSLFRIDDFELFWMLNGSGKQLLFVRLSAPGRAA